MEYEKVIALPFTVPCRGTSPDGRLTVPESESPCTCRMTLNSRVPPGVFMVAFHSPATDWAEADGTAANTARAKQSRSVRMENSRSSEGERRRADG